MVKKILPFLMMLILFSCSGAAVNILSGVTQDSANDVIMTLGQNNINATKLVQKDGTFKIFVTGNDQIKALTILKSSGLPNQNYTSLGEEFKKDGFISSPLEENARLEYALNQEISSMLSLLNGVLEVKTEVSLPTPTDNLWQSSQVKPTVAVVIRYRQGEKLDIYLNRIKELVSHSVPGVTSDGVSVLTVQQKDHGSNI